MISELTLESVKLEGHLFKLHCRLDKTQNPNEFVKIKNEIDETTARIEQYKIFANEFNRMEKIASVKRKMRR